MAEVLNRKMAGRDHAVVSCRGEDGHMEGPCKECPWRKANAGSFPKEAFVISANTATDMSNRLFGCHMSGVDHVKTCAGFLLSETSHDNMGVRMLRIKRDSRDSMLALWKRKPEFDGLLFETYREMAIANGVSSRSAALRMCMPEAKYGPLRKDSNG